MLCCFVFFCFVTSHRSSPGSIASIFHFMPLCVQFCFIQIESSKHQCHRQKSAMVCSAVSSEHTNCFNQISKRAFYLHSTQRHVSLIKVLVQGPVLCRDSHTHGVNQGVYVPDVFHSIHCRKFPTIPQWLSVVC